MTWRGDSATLILSKNTAPEVFSWNLFFVSRCFCCIVEEGRKQPKADGKIGGGVIMAFLCNRRSLKVCPRTGKTIGQVRKYGFVWWLFPITGLVALVWFLIRVIPKPSRATYPCQRVAFPIASGFIIWLTGILGSVVAFHRAKAAMAKARYAVAAVSIVVSVALVWFSMSATFDKTAKAVVRPAQPANSPMGTAVGVNPGRVAWIWDANATDWVYTNQEQTEHWYEPEHTDQAVVSEMLSKALRAYTGKSTDYAAWDAMFRYFNQQRGKGDVGYQPGEKIGIKINNTLCCLSDPCTMDKNSTNPWWHPNYMNYIDNSPQLTIALLKQLTDVVGVAPGDISIGDPGKIIPNYWYDMVEPNCPGVVYVSVVGGMGRTQSTWSTVEFNWSDPCAAHFPADMEQDYIPTCFADANYFINFPVLKSHDSGGVTICGKNHYGSLIRNPDGTMSYELPGTDKNKRYNMHATLPGGADPWPPTPGLGHYRCLVDLMGHRELGGKTVLCLVDALFAAETWEAHPSKWTIAPFNNDYNDWPSSIFVSQDQVAADSVGFDFLLAQWPKDPGANMSGSDDYLHEAALANDPCSGAFYDPEGDGTRLASLGVHEHWNNVTAKKYTRNLGTGAGIELVNALPGYADLDGDNYVDFNDFAVFAAAWRSTTGSPNWNADCDISMPSDGVIDELDLAIFCDNWLAEL